MTGLAPEEDSPNLAEIVFQGKVGVSRGWNVEIRNFALNPDIGKRRFQKIFDLLGEFRNGENGSNG